MPRKSIALLAVLGSCIAIFWPGALTFGFPGVMAPIWQEMFHVGRTATGITIFFMLAAVGVFMFLVGRWQEHYGTRKMIILGIILVVIGLFAKISVLLTIGVILLVIGAVLAVMGMAGREIGGRRHFY